MDFLLCCPRGPDHQGRHAVQRQNQQQTAPPWAAGAEKAAADHDAQPATLLAEQANVDAELAEATAQEHRSQKAESELQASLQALREQANQASPTASPPPVAPQPLNQ